MKSGAAGNFPTRFYSLNAKDALGGKNIVIVVMTGADSNDRHWIITAYLARKLAGGETIWNKN